MTITEKERQFILELNCLTRKHKIKIGGCGCCGSPHLEEFEKEPGPNDGYACDGSEKLEWIEEAYPYLREDDMERIVR